MDKTDRFFGKESLLIWISEKRQKKNDAKTNWLFYNDK